MTVPNSLQTQVGGSHYKKYRYQPLEFAEKHGLSPIIFCIFKYVCRYRDKQKPVEDLQKALHCVDIFVECGKEKDILYNVDRLSEFLEQFDNEHGKAIFDVLRLQGDKSQADEARISINHLLKGVQ